MFSRKYYTRNGLILDKRLRDVLSKSFSSEELACFWTSYDIIGDMAIIRMTGTSREYCRVVAETIMNVHKNVKTVLVQTSPVRGDFRLRKLEFVAGEDKTTTTHKEFGSSFSVDVGKCYFSPRLLFERMRIAKQVGNREVVVNMFAGVGCFSIIIAKHSRAKRIYSIDVNPAAFTFMRDNVRLNRVYGKVIPIFGDAEEIVAKKLCGVADRVLMPLPEKTLEYLPFALSALRKSRGLIHCYAFEYAKKKENSIQKAKLKMIEKLESMDVIFEIPFGRVVRTAGPHWYQIALDIVIKR